MIIIFTVISIVLLAIGIYQVVGSAGEEGYGVTSVGVFVFIICFVGGLCLLDRVIGEKAIDGKIAMYEEENASIEAQVEAAVNNYIAYEGQTFADIAQKSDGGAITLATLFPELNSNTLVQTQIQIYQENTKAMKELRAEKIGLYKYKWWLYFGGEEKK